MKAAEVFDIFSHFWDKYGDAGIENHEISRHVNTAQIAVLKDHFFNQHLRKQNHEEPPFGFENNQYSVEAWLPLISEFTGVLDANGKLLYSTIEAGFPTNTIEDEAGTIEVKQCSLFHINSIAREDGAGQFKYCRYVRHNDYEQLLDNPFKQPTERFPTVRRFSNSLVVNPAAAVNVRLSVTRTPIHMSIDNSVDPELPDFTMYDVIFRALGYAGINIRERELLAYMGQEEGKQ